MKRLWALGVMALLAFGLPGSREVLAGPGGRVSFQVFYDELSPYGQWINDPEYGYVWAPRVERDFQPYASRGHWVMTEYGNTWVSDYDWGWAPFHYGRWMYDDYYGWLWLPGQEWGPAWVDWRHTDGYYGWAPMGPRVTYVVAPARWVFVPVRYISSPRIYSYCLPRTQVVNIYHHTTIVNNYYERDNHRYVYGPRSKDIERYTRQKVQVHRLDSDSRPGRTQVADNSLRLYRPEVDSRRREAPTRVAVRENRAASHSRVTETQPSSARIDRSSDRARGRTAVESTSSSGSMADDARIDRREPVGEQLQEQRPQPSRSVGTGRATYQGRIEPSPARAQGEASPSSRSEVESRRYERTPAPAPRQRSSAIEPAVAPPADYSPQRSTASPQGRYQPAERQSHGNTAPAQRSSSSRSDSPRRESPARGRN
ncbi:DUF6600 domain-containing protein [Rufibacter ruber]|uniref:DUF6600 domain-containing protein n=1 Tax=Rufibacter ruber TaxID=1783499 RepID=UPI00082F89FA|nr:DUF6600 domain-containing protein [Rufibacter ruber]